MTDFVKAWEYWDETPKDSVATNKKEDAVRAEAIRFGISSTALHDDMTDMRRLGLTVRQAYVELQEHYLS